MRTKGYILVIISLAALLSGGWSSFALFRYLAGTVREPAPRQDTVLVKLLNGLPYRADTTQFIDKGGVKKENRPAVNKLQARYDSLASVQQAVKTTYRPAPPMTAIAADSINVAVASGKLALVRFPWWWVIFGGLMTVMVVLILLYYRLPYLSPDIRKDLDPEELTGLFKDFGPEIEEIGNPRKIKRLSNKIRFQYHYIKEKGWKDVAASRLLMQVLLALEKKPWLKDADPSKKGHDPSTEPDFWGAFPESLRLDAMTMDKRLRHLIYVLNRDML